MVGFDKDKITIITLTQEERYCILDYCPHLSHNLLDKVGLAKDDTLYLMESEADMLKLHLRYAVQIIPDQDLIFTVNGLLNKIFPGQDTLTFSDSNISMRPTNSAAERIWEHMEKLGEAPDPLRGYLTENQITRFTDYHWGDKEFPLRFNRKLSLKKVNQSVFFRNTRLFLNKVMEHQNTPILTATGNLNRKFVKLMFEEMELDEEKRECAIKYNKVINEEDVFPLHIINIICKAAGLTHKRAKKLYIYKKCQPLLDTKNAGELYYQLFDTFFNKFNLSYLDRLPEVDGIQETFDFSLYSIYRLCDKYQSVEDLFHEAFLPSIINEIEETVTSEYVRKEWYLNSRIMRPLEDFGLVECKYEGEPKRSHIAQVKKTPLFDKFMSLKL